MCAISCPDADMSAQADGKDHADGIYALDFLLSFFAERRGAQTSDDRRPVLIPARDPRSEYLAEVPLQSTAGDLGDRLDDIPIRHKSP